MKSFSSTPRLLHPNVVTNNNDFEVNWTARRSSLRLQLLSLFKTNYLMRRSVRSFNILPGIPTVIWTFEDCFIQISVAPTQCSNALPKCRISWSIFFCKRQDQRLWLSCRPLLSHMLAKVNSLPFITSILKDKTHMFRWKDFGSSSQIPTPPRQGSNPPPLARSLLGVNVEGSDCSAHYAAISKQFFDL